MSYSTITPPAVSSTAIAQTVWSYSPRSLTDMQNLINAIQNNNPNMLSTLSDIVYIPLPYFAGQVSITQVASFINNLVQNYGLVGPVASGISASPYNLWTTSFVTQLIPYLNVTSLNQIIMSSQTDGNHAQTILYYLIQNYYYNEWIQTITASYGSTTISTNVTITTSPIFAQSLTISTGVTVTCGLHTCYFITQQFNNYGAIVNQNGAIGGTGTGGGGNGGTGGGGIVVLAITSALGTLNVNGGTGINSGAAGGASYGQIGGTGILFSLSTNVALGGNNGGYQGGAGAPSGTDGGYGATGGSVILYLFNNGNSILNYIMQGVSDWWAINALDKSLSSTTPLPILYNAGGGGGGSNGSGGVGGGGGGGGGEVIAYAYNIISGNISANGGYGGNLSSGSNIGGGGGGGLIFVFYGSTSGSLTFSVIGGTGNAAGGKGIATTIQVTVNG